MLIGAKILTRLASGVVVGLLLLGCGSSVQKSADWPPKAKKWFERAEASFRSLDVEDAEHAIGNALRLDPKRPEVRRLAAAIALAELDYDRAIALLEGMKSSEARAIRGRAYWYSGRVAEAADELEQLLSDPEVRDPWATDVAKLARRGVGRTPFRLSGGLLAVTEMPRVAQTAMVVPLELDGEPALGMISTGVTEVVIDSSGGREASWVSLRFADRVEVKDVPALTRDLSSTSRQLNAPIKVLLGVNLLRQLNATIDFEGSQFVVRTFEPPPPPNATTAKLHYIRGGGMVLRSRFGTQENSPGAAMLISTAMQYPVALDADGWSKTGVNPASLKGVPGGSGLRQGLLPNVRLGAFDVPGVPGVAGVPLDEFETSLGVDLDGVVGSGLLAAFRVTLVDGGRTMWLEAPPTPMPPQADAVPDLEHPAALTPEGAPGAAELPPSPKGQPPPATGRAGASPPPKQK